MRVSQDYDLISKYQETGDSRYCQKLIDLYEPIITKKAFTYYQKVSYNRHLTFDDLKSEMYCAFLRAVKYVKLDKITNPDSWQIFIIFDFASRNSFKKLMGENKREYQWRTSSNFEDMETVEYLASFEDDTNNKTEAFLDISKIKDCLTPQKKIILELYLKGNTMTEISNILGVSFQSISRHIKRIKEIIQLKNKQDLMYKKRFF